MCHNDTEAFLTHGARGNFHHLANGIFKLFFFRENRSILVKNSWLFSTCTINDKLALVQRNAWCRAGERTLSEKKRLFNSLNHICLVGAHELRPIWLFILDLWITCSFINRTIISNLLIDKFAWFVRYSVSRTGMEHCSQFRILNP